jgi:hypothetical protein
LKEFQCGAEIFYLRNKTITVKIPTTPTVPMNRVVLENNLSKNPIFPFISFTNESIGSYIVMFLSFNEAQEVRG